MYEIDCDKIVYLMVERKWDLDDLSAETGLPGLPVTLLFDIADGYTETVKAATLSRLAAAFNVNANELRKITVE